MPESDAGSVGDGVFVDACVRVTPVLGTVVALTFSVLSASSVATACLLFLQGMLSDIIVGSSCSRGGEQRERLTQLFIHVYTPQRVYMTVHSTGEEGG